ncbi:preprotein translocase subunit SecA [SAR86 cluster bacterium]|nr:preprotein translocase subunit SecA [SAR86 cluster bacterium]
MAFLNFIFGKKDKKALKDANKLLISVNNLEDSFESLSDSELKNRTAEFKSRFKKGEDLISLLPEAFAAVRESSKRTIKLRHYDCQILGGVILNEGKIAEMATGEGKTLVATLPCYLRSLTEKSSLVITANEYLAERDAKWMQPIYELLGLTVGFVISSLDPVSRKEAYSKDVVYVTNNEIGFDYLRDNMVLRKEDRTMRDPYFAVVDEVDSILIDEARTPLIISGVAEDNSKLYRKLKSVAPKLSEEILDPETGDVEQPGDFQIDLASRSIDLTNSGHEKVENAFRAEGLISVDDTLYATENLKLLDMLLSILRANLLFQKNTDYLVNERKIVLIDTNTGRAMPGRRLSGGVHQALEMKEGLDIQVESQTLASTTFQNFFRMFEVLAGMTGTAKTEAEEFEEIYALDTVSIPTNLPMIRDDGEDKIFLSVEEKYDAVVGNIEDFHSKGNPILVGTISVETSELISNKLNEKGIDHRVLNAKQNEQEAEIIAQAGRAGSVTIATNMAGRGTDIVLGGLPESKENKEKVLSLGGLHVIGTERHESRRIDNQLRGRCARQGDPGSTQFFVSLEDPLMQIFAPDRMKNLMKSIGGMQPGEAIEHRMLTNALERAQRRVEGRNFDVRKRILEFDDVLNEQRQVIYEQRKEILYDENISDLVRTMRADVLSKQFDKYIPEYEIEANWQVEELRNIFRNDYDLKIDIKNILEKFELDLPDSISEIIQSAEAAYKEKIGNDIEVYKEVEKQIVLQVIDQSWKNHINSLEHLRQNIGFRSYAGKDPRLEYKRESFEMFQELLESIKEDSIRYLCKVRVTADEGAQISNPSAQKIVTNHADAPSAFEINEKKEVPKNKLDDEGLEGNRKLRRMQAKANRKKR